MINKPSSKNPRFPPPRSPNTAPPRGTPSAPNMKPKSLGTAHKALHRGVPGPCRCHQHVPLGVTAGSQLSHHQASQRPPLLHMLSSPRESPGPAARCGKVTLPREPSSARRVSRRTCLFPRGLGGVQSPKSGPWPLSGLTSIVLRFTAHGVTGLQGQEKHLSQNF